RFCSSRRSVSSWVSPGPRRPMEPPRWRSRWVQPRTRRVAMCRSWASSTCSLPSALRARWEKISRIRPVRSTTRRCSAFSRLRSCTGVSGWLTRTRSAPVASAAAFTSSSLPLPIRVAGFGRSMRALSNAATLAPADRARSANSSSSPSSGGPPAWGWISSAFSPLRERSNIDPRCGRDTPYSSLVGGGRLGLVLAALARAVHAHVARRHHGGDRVLVDHLADGVAQQDHELVEGLDRALELDAVDQVDRNRHAFAAQCVQERVLQGLPLGHGVCPLLCLFFFVCCYSARLPGRIARPTLPVAATGRC